MTKERFFAIIAYWRVISGGVHATICVLAGLASAHLVPMSGELLAVMIAWANLCSAVHRFAGGKNGNGS